MWTKLIAAEWKRRRGTGQSMHKPSGRRSLRFERLESREVLSASLQATLVDALASCAVPGGSLTVQTAIVNNGSDVAKNLTVEYRLSNDQGIDASDTLIGRVTKTDLLPGDSVEWSQSLTIPATLAHADYYLGMIAQAADAAPATLADASVTEILSTSLSGTVTYNGKSRSVSIRSFTSGAGILDNVATWIVIHGRNSSPSSSNLVQLATALDARFSNDQLLVLDWSSAAASGLFGGAGENYIKPVAAWASSALTVYGLMPDELNLVGHSWGAYVAAELAELEPALGTIPHGVNSIVALDPATDYPGGSYNPTASGEVNFARNSHFSWSFYAYGGLFGSATTAQTAHESFVVTGTDHSKLANVVGNLVTVNFAGQFDLDRLLAGTSSGLWAPNSYSSSGRRSSSGTFEAVIAATSDRLRVKSLRLFNGQAEVIYYA